MLPSRRPELRPELGARPGRPGGRPPGSAEPSSSQQRRGRGLAQRPARSAVHGAGRPRARRTSASLLLLVMVGDCVFLRSRKDRMEAFLKQMKNVSKPSDFIWALKVQGFFFCFCFLLKSCHLLPSPQHKWCMSVLERGFIFFFRFCNNGNYKLPKLLWRNELSTAHLCKEKV